MKTEKIQNSYERLTEKDRLTATIIAIKSIVHGFGYENINDLEKLFLINDEVFVYNRNYLVES